MNPLSLSRLMLLAVVAAPFAASAGDARPLSFAEHGFSISPLEGHTEGNQQVLMMFMPTIGKFSPNVNVQIQAFEGSIDDYMKLSKDQFKTMGIKMLNETPAKGSVAMEYAGTQQGMPLHFYARAVAGKKHVYLVTATAAEDQWTTVSAALKKCVDSFKPTP